MFLTVFGIIFAILNRGNGNKTLSFNYSKQGLLYAFGGSFGQALGLVLSKYGMGTYDAFASTQIRIIAGIAGFTLLFFLFPLKAWTRVHLAVQDRTAMQRITLGSFFGPFLGVSLSLLAVQYTTTGAASTIMSIVPILVIPPAVFIFKEKVSMREVVGACIAVAGVAMMFL